MDTASLVKKFSHHRVNTTELNGIAYRQMKKHGISLDEFRAAILADTKDENKKLVSKNLNNVTGEVQRREKSRIREEAQERRKKRVFTRIPEPVPVVEPVELTPVESYQVEAAEPVQVEAAEVDKPEEVAVPEVRGNKTKVDLEARRREILERKEARREMLKKRREEAAGSK